MPERVAAIMSTDLVSCERGSSVADAAKEMRDRNVGDVLVTDGDRLVGILTDRDIAIRAVAEGLDPDTVEVGTVCTTDVATVSSSDAVTRAAEVMRQHAIRRLPVVDDGRLVGVVSLGDLAIERDRESVLADVSAAPPNN